MDVSYIPAKKRINEPYYGDDLSEEIRRDSYNADNDLYEADTPYDYIVAGRGFHGIIDHPTKVLAGEHGKERVSIHKIRKLKNTHLDYDISEFMNRYRF